MCKRAFKQGWAGVAYKTICMMDIHESSPRFSSLKDFDESFVGFKNIEQLSQNILEDDCEIFRKLKKNYPKTFSPLGKRWVHFHFCHKSMSKY